MNTLLSTDNLSAELIWTALEKFIDPDTGVLYDNSLGRAELPSRDQVLDDVPNQCGWTSGFEDAALNAGFLLPDVIQLAQQTGDEKWQTAAARLADLLLKLVTVSDTPGFVARGVLPDGVTYYRDSSTDQYTMAFRAMHAISQWEGAGATRQRRAAQFVADAMALLQRHQWDIPTADGQKSWVGETSQFWPDRASRLLQFAVTNAAMNPGEASLSLYRTLREECHSRRARGLFSKPGYATIPYALLQTQVSLRMLWELEPDPEYKMVWRLSMDDLAENAVLQLQARDFTEIIEKIEHLSSLPEPVSAMELYTEENYANRHNLEKAAGSFGGYYWKCNTRLHTEQGFIRQPLELALCFALGGNSELVDYNGTALLPIVKNCIEQISRAIHLDDIRFCHSAVSLFVAAA